MKCNVLAICDEQVAYTDFLTKQLLRMEENVFHVCRFTTMEQLQAYASDHEITCLLVSELYEEVIQEVEARQYFSFTIQKIKARLRPSEGGSRQVKYIYRYQSVESIYQQIVEAITLETNEKENDKIGEKEVQARLIGVYNPVHRNGQTTFARALANIQGRRGRRVLYLNMEEYAGIQDSERDERGDLGEVLYYLKQDIKSINFRLASFTKRVESYDVVLPMEMSQELRKISYEEWATFLEQILERSGYEIIILDLDSCILGILEILELCTQIYMPLRNGNGGDEKRKQFLNNLEKLQKYDLHNKILYMEVEELHGETILERQHILEEKIEERLQL
ncbi:MAG: hypothetical protein R3Y58_06740 [Eubacteriales bacterium]